MARFEETVFMERAPVVDRERGVISGVKLLGWESRNKRKYMPKARESAAKKYVGVKNYVNHDRNNSERGMEEWASVTTEAHIESDGIYGSLQMRQKSPHYEPLMEAAEKFPKQFGMSHVAEGESRFEDGVELVEDVSTVLSIDFVPDPATTAGLFESARKRTAINEAISTLPNCPQRKALTEMMGSYGIGDMPAEDSKPTDPLAAFEAMCLKLIEMLGAALEAKNTPAPPAMPAPGAPTDQEADKKPEDEDEEMSDEQKQAFESLSRENAELKASTMLLESGREATDVRKKALANCETDEERKELLESWPTIEQAERPARSPGLIESDQGFPRGNTKRFADSLR